MSRRHRAFAALGALAFLGGAVLAFAPGLAASLSLGRLLVLALGVVAGLFALGVVRIRRASDPDGSDVPAVERALALPNAGHRFDEALAALGAGTRWETRKRHHDLCEEVAPVAVALLVRHRGYDETAAREALQTGAWTADPYAAACFRDHPAGWLPWPERVRATFASEPLRARCLRHVVGELDRLAAGERA